MTKGDNATKETGYGTIETRKWTLETEEKREIFGEYRKEESSITLDLKYLKILGKFWGI